MEQIFSNNRKISIRQIRRTLILEMLGISTLLLPQTLAGQCGSDGVFALILGAGGAALLLQLWKRFTQKQDFQQALGSCTKPVQLLVSVIYGIVFIWVAGYVLFLLTKIMREQLLDVKYEPLILFTLTAAGIFGLLKGLESRVRIYEVIFWFLLVPLIIILCLASASVNVDYWPPVFASDKIGFLKGIYTSFLFSSISSLFLLFQPHSSKPKRAIAGVQTSLIVVTLLNVAIYLILVGVFQTGLLAQLPFPVITLMAVVKLPGEFFERQDAFMTAIWFFCLFALFNSMLFYGKEMLQKAGQILETKKQEREAGKENALWVCICGAASLAVAVCFLRGWTAVYLEKIFVLGVLPVVWLLPIVIFGGAIKKGKQT